MMGALRRQRILAIVRALLNVDEFVTRN